MLLWPLSLLSFSGVLEAGGHLAQSPRHRALNRPEGTSLRARSGSRGASNMNLDFGPRLGARQGLPPSAWHRAA
eukprot:9493093-Pyramimonas_sp.AAC.1